MLVKLTTGVHFTNILLANFMCSNFVFEFFLSKRNVHNSRLKLFVKQTTMQSILQTFYEQFLLKQIPKAQKIQSSHQSFWGLLGSACVKAVFKMLVKLTTGREWKSGLRYGLAGEEKAHNSRRKVNSVTSVIPFILTLASRIYILQRMKSASVTDRAIHKLSFGCFSFHIFV